MSRRSRREFLLTTGTGVAAGLLLPTAGRAREAAIQGAGPLRIRKNFIKPSAANDVASLSKGVDAMRKLAASDPSDPRGWVLQAFIHGDCTQFTKCQHGNWFFPPWHRSFIYYFEALIQSFANDPTFALPYWDWTRTHGIPASFYGATNPLNGILSLRPPTRPPCPNAPTAGRGRTVNDMFSQRDLDTFVGPTVINRIQQNPDYDTYGGSNPGTGELEGTPHNFIHRWVGGAKGSNMVQTFSPADPIFWMHHCNIDRLYSNWLVRPGHNTPPDTAWKTMSFNDFFDKDKKPVGSQFTCEATKDSKVMGYVYDEIMEVPTTMTTSGQPPAGGPQVLGSMAATKMTKQAGVMAFATDAAPSPETRRSMNAAALGAPGFAVRLRIDGVKVPARQNTAVHVFMGPPVTADTPITAPGYIGTFTFFDAPHQGDAGGGHGGTKNLLLNASGAMQRLYGDTNLPDSTSVAVSLVTRPLYTGVTAYAAVEEVQPDRVQLEVVKLGS